MKFKNLSRYQTGGTGSKMDLALPLPRTPDGRVYRYSPAEDAHPRHFVLGEVKAEISPTPELRARMKLDPHSPQTVCPYSGTVAEDQAFTHPDDYKAAVEMVRHAAIEDVQSAFSDMFKGLGSSGGGMLRIETKVSSSKRPKPQFGRRDLMRELICDHCGRDYGVFAIGLFCPDCGAPNLRLHFAREAELVGDQVSLAEGLGEGKDELAYRLLGNAHEDVLTAFEATLKTVFFHGFRQQKPGEPLPNVRNDFQNVGKATERFATLGFNPFDGLTDGEREALELNIQMRHVIGHNLGVADAKFASSATDAKLGETLHLVGEDIRLFAALGQRVVDRLDAWLGGAPSPTIGQEAPLVMKEPAVTPNDPEGLMKLDLDVSLLARKVAVWMARRDEDGLRDYEEGEDLMAAFTENTMDELAEAIAELEADGLVQTTHMMSERLPMFRPTLDLYLNFDPVACGTSPVKDILALAESVLAAEDVGNVPGLFAATGWTRRRFNPALGAVLAQIDDRRVSRTMDGEFPTRSFFLMAEDRVALKRFVARLKG